MPRWARWSSSDKRLEKAVVEYKKGLHPGAVWKRTDLQIHTPRDAQWKGSASLKGGTPELEEGRQAWADGFVDQCVKSGLGAISVTDHHDFCFTDYVQKSIERRFGSNPPLWFFPGVEITCNDSVQCLMFFDADVLREECERLFGGHLQAIAKPNPDAGCAPQTQPCGKELARLIESIAQDPKLAGRSILLPHGSDGSGHKGIVRDGMHIRFRELPFDGVYIEKTFHELPLKILRKVRGEASEWGLRRRGIIATGDNRSQTFEKLGKNECWIRLGEPTAEAIRQALLADKARITFEEPELPLHRIVQLHVKSTLTGDSFWLSFNDGFTALIGGRGSGKSSVLEYLQFGLGRSELDSGSENASRQSRSSSLIESTLVDGFVEIILERDGVLETWLRTGSEKEKIKVSVDQSNFELSPIEAQTRFQARGFRQKQLSSLVAEPSEASNQITSIAAAEFVGQQRQLEHEISALQREVVSKFQRIIEFWLVEEELKQNRLRVADVVRRIEAVHEKLKRAGLAAGDQALLESAPKYRLAADLFQELPESISIDIGSLSGQVASLASLDSAHWESLVEEFPEVKEVLDEIKEVKKSVQDRLNEAVSSLSGLKQTSSRLQSQFSQKQVVFDEKHAKAIMQQAHMRSMLQEVETLEQDKKHLLASERKGMEKFEGLHGAPDELASARNRLHHKAVELHELMMDAAQKVESMSDGILSASAHWEEVPSDYYNTLMSICDKNRIRDVGFKCEERAKALATNDDGPWSAFCDGLLNLLRNRVANEYPKFAPSDGVKRKISEILIGELTDAQYDSVYASLDENTVVSVLTATKKSYISFEYSDNGTFIPFKTASPGQQSSAILKLLLNQEAGTLIVDQPEDDLDNRVIIDIANQLQTTKRKRQLIFSTHNPNFVVNGDADKVVALRPGGSPNSNVDDPRVNIDVDGAIETPAVRNAVTETMEGGQLAFELRSRKYRFPS